MTTDAPVFSGSIESRMTPQSVVLGAPFPRDLGVTLMSATQKQYDTLTRELVSAWTQEESRSKA